ncbi:MAG TPA: ATP-binding protein [Gaiellales bacterium]|nr:ATP-binding protein [Gaiellales bacterium]
MLVEPSGSGKTTFAAAHFARTEVVSSDGCRALVSDDETNMDATPGAFRVLHAIVRERLRLGRLTVVDATNVQADKRARLLKLARERGRPAVAIVFDLPDAIYLERNRTRPDRSIPEYAVVAQIKEMRHTLQTIESEGFHQLHRVSGALA